MCSLNTLQMDVHRGHQQIFTTFFHTCLGLRHVSSKIACLHFMLTKHSNVMTVF